MDRLPHGPRRGRPPHPDVLTPAEWRVLERVRDGASNAEIADRLDVSVNTVRYHVSSMLAKLDLNDRVDLAAWVGEPAPASQSALRRFSLAVPLAWLRESRWPGKAAAAGAVVTLSVVGIVTIASMNSGSRGIAPPPFPANDATRASEGIAALTDTELHELATLAGERAGAGNAGLRLQSVSYFPDDTRYLFDFVDPEQRRWVQVTATAGTPHEEWEVMFAGALGERLWRGESPELPLEDVRVDVHAILDWVESRQNEQPLSVGIHSEDGTDIRVIIRLTGDRFVDLLVDHETGEVLDRSTGEPVTGF